MNSMAVKFSDLVKEEIEIIQELKKVSVEFGAIVAHRNLEALQENNTQKKTALLKMLHVQKTKDSLIGKLSISIGLSEDSSVREILTANILDKESELLLSSSYLSLLEEMRELSSVNAFVSLVLSRSYRLLKNAINVFNAHGTIESVYCNKVNKIDIGTVKRHGSVNEKV